MAYESRMSYILRFVLRTKKASLLSTTEKHMLSSMISNKTRINETRHKRIVSDITNE